MIQRQRDDTHPPFQIRLEKTRNVLVLAGKRIENG